MATRPRLSPGSPGRPGPLSPGLALAVALGLLAGPAAPVAGQTRGAEARVVKVLEADVVRVRFDNGHVDTVRYIGVTFPGSDRPGGESAAAAREAREANRRLVEGQTIRLELDVAQWDRDGRLLAYVWLGERLVNVELVRLGHLEAMTVLPNVRYQDLLLRAQDEAREARRGIWGR